MKLREVLQGAPVVGAIPAGDLEIAGIEYDSRRAGSGFLFFAFRGAKADGAAFAAHAVSRGAVAVASETAAPEGFPAPWITVSHGRQALAIASRNYFQAPDRRVQITGITGTNGKTTTSYLIDSIARAAGKTTALVGTIEYRLGSEILPAVNTTPESLDLIRLFDRLDRAGGTHATIEASSHALALGRIHGIDFHTAVFSNLTRDHLDFHGTMDAYFAAKRLLFEGAGGRPPRFAVINADDEWGRKIRPAGQTHAYWYGFGDCALLRPGKVVSSFHGLRFTVESPGATFPVESPLVGRINVYNILAACGAGLAAGFDPEVISRGVASCRAVPGRFERVDEGQPFAVVVDYAHTDDALRNTLAVARSLAPKRILTLFGCGGDRDRAKRPLMGLAAAQASDLVFLTSDNPRSEDPLRILNDAVVGLQKENTPYSVEPDRATAIQKAIRKAEPGDIVILAGKGHETYQVLQDRTIYFDDREVARQALQSLGYRKERP